MDTIRNTWKQIVQKTRQKAVDQKYIYNNMLLYILFYACARDARGRAGTCAREARVRRAGV